MVSLKINVAPRAYEAIIDDGLLARAGAHLREVAGTRQRLFVVTVPPVRRRWGKKLAKSLVGAGFKSEFVEMRDGERYKRLATVEELAEKMTRLGADRSAIVVAFGGGVVGDVGGMLASVYMRGVELVQIPTTVQAQVDASIGGKTGVNLRKGKNLVGTFYQPLTVLIDPAVLSTLPDREFRAGLYESLKAGVIGLPDLFRALENTEISQLRRDPKKLEWVIAESVKLKARVVSADEREGGLRRVLNLGHTIGHALESATDYRHFLHGEAVAWGMVAAAHIAVATGRLKEECGNKIQQATLAMGPLPAVNTRSRSILALLQSDKKTRDGVVHFVLPRAIGEVEVANDVPASVVVDAVDELRRLSK